jgi:hypothetical protein
VPRRGPSARRRIPARLAALALGATLLGACAGPDFQYAAEKPAAAPAGSVFFKVPHSWTQFPAATIAKAEQGWDSAGDGQLLMQNTAWQEAYDAAEQPALDHVLGRATPQSPVVYASLRTLYPEEQPGASTAALRDLLVPVSSLGKAITITTDETLRQGSVTGVHLVFSYVPAVGRPEETIDQTAYLSDGSDAVYLLVVRCSTTCYAAHRDEITAVTSSYTIQEARRG